MITVHCFLMIQNTAGWFGWQNLHAGCFTDNLNNTDTKLLILLSYNGKLQTFL